MKSKHKSLSPLTNVVRKPQVTHQGLLFREIPTPASPSSKKRRATDMAKHISKKKKKKSKMIISSESTTDEDETIPETPEVDLHKQSSTPAQTDVIPPEDSVAKSVSEEARNPDILVNDVISEIVVSFPPQLTPIVPTTSTTDSPTFENIIKQPITSLFSSQSTYPPTTTSPIQDSNFKDTGHESKGFGGMFENLEFDEEETVLPDHMLMTMKQFKILNTKLNPIL
ncbi:unnamed protein product [Lactuca saligna]|uniref:Uncharacterized protein n=1 Tax=Lactuca saligna TaxID=75948 RepID=A0AA35XZ66_LACSI|nr:unnamed protein product [Lactuca saligna]